MFDAIKEWLSGLFGGASEHVDSAKQHLEEINPQEKVENFTQNAGEQVGQKANDLKDNFPKQ